MTLRPRRVLFVCTGNSARSLMAEALLRAAAGGAVEVTSAGIEPRGVNPLTLRALEAACVPTTGLRSKSVDEVRGRTFDVVITVCDAAREACPVFPGGGERRHWSLDDPAAAQGNERERFAFERARDEIARRVRDLVPELVPA